MLNTMLLSICDPPPSDLPSSALYVRMEIAERYLSVMDELARLSANVAIRVQKSHNLSPSTLHTLFEVDERLATFRSLEPLNLKPVKNVRGVQILTRVIKSYIFSKILRPMRETPIGSSTIRYVQCIPDPF